MSSLEERREARRRRRQMEEEEDSDGVVASSEDAYNIEKRKQEREERLQRIAAGFSTINGEDELERRRRERREQRLRSGVTETPEEDTSSRRSRRRRGTEDEIDATPSEEVTSTRSRRRRGGDEETESAPAPEPEPTPTQDNSEEEERQRREAQEEAERQRQAEAARRRAEEEEDQRRAEEEERRRQQKEDEERRRREEENEDTLSESETNSDMTDSEKSEKLDTKEKERKINEQYERLNAMEKDHDLFIEEKRRNGTVNGSSLVQRKSDERGKILSPKDPVRRSVMDYSLRTAEDGKCEKLKSFFEEKQDEQLNGENNEMSKSLTFNKKIIGSALLEDKSPVHEKLKKFETNLQTKEQQETKKEFGIYQTKVISPGPSRLKDIQKRFEESQNSPSTENTSSRLGRLSSSESHLNERPGLHKDSKKHVLDRWQSVIEPKKPQKKEHSRLSKSMSTSDYDLNKKGDNIERLTSKFDHNRNEKPEKILRSATLPHNTHKDMELLKRQWSQEESQSSNSKDTTEQKSNNRHSVPKVTERWLSKTQSVSTEAKLTQPAKLETNSRPKSTSSVESKKESNSSQISGMNIWRRKSSTKSEEEARLEQERLEEEERQREEAARIMEEQQKKKKGKRKGLGGLSPEKKKMLKKLIMQKAAEDLRNEAKAKAEEKEKYINERVGPLKLEGKSEGDLVQLCKELNNKLAQLEEEVYDWEVKIRKQDQEIIQLTLKVNDSKGKFAKPVLKKVNKTESKLNKIAKKDKADFRDNLKSSGQSKFALDEEGEEKK